MARGRPLAMGGTASATVKALPARSNRAQDGARPAAWAAVGANHIVSLHRGTSSEVHAKGGKKNLPISMNLTPPCKYTAVIVRARLYDLLPHEAVIVSAQASSNTTKGIIPQSIGRKT